MPVTVHPRDAGLALARTLKPKKKASRRADTPEKDIQEAVESYLRLRGIAYLHIPAFILNAAFSGRFGISGTALAGAMSNAAKDVRGFPDLCIFHPDGKRYLAIELKTDVGTLTPSQKRWKEAIGGHIIRSAEDAILLIDSWLEEPDGARTMTIIECLKLKEAK